MYDNDRENKIGAKILKKGSVGTFENLLALVLIDSMTILLTYQRNSHTFQTISVFTGTR